MKLFTLYKKLFVRSPMTRTITWILLIILCLGMFRIVDRRVMKKPDIHSITPLIGVPGDTMKIRGSNFGDSRKNSYVEIAGSKITSSGYSSWSDNEISLIIPQNVQDGLVFVCTSSGKSEPGFFANEMGIPVAVQSDPTSTIPSITSIEPQTASTGQIVTIYGSNFGISRGTSKIFFTANREEQSTNFTDTSTGTNSQNSMYIEANALDFDYEQWSDTEIKVRVPDGAGSGAVYIETEKGNSSASKIALNYPAGKKLYSSKRTFVIQISADISNHVAAQDSTISLYIPKPAISAIQPYCELNDIYPDPLILDDPHNIIHMKQLNKITNNQQRFSQTFVVSAYTVKNNIKASGIGVYKDKKNPLYLKYITPDQLILSEDSTVAVLMQKIIEKEKNPYNQAKIIYNFIADNYKLTEKNHEGETSVLETIRKKKGDAYDLAVLYTTLCRAAKIPCIPVSGILVHNKNKAESHWWTEIWFENYGWFPVDIALAKGLAFEPYAKVENPREFYFGNLDNQHIAFTRGWHQIRQSGGNSKIVYRPRTYAMQSIWEEAGDSTSSYSSLWNDPVIQGIY